MKMKLHEEFKVYENMWDTAPVKNTLKETSGKHTTKQPKRLLTEARSVADIEAEIARLQQELEQAKTAEKKASYGGNIPTDVWYWDIYFNPDEKGTWTSIDNDTVYETKDAALNGAYNHLSELDDEGELEYDVDDYYVDAVKIPVSKVSTDALEWSGLGHLLNESKKLNEAAPTKDYFTWTIGSDSYDISNNAELRAYIKAAAAEKLATNTAKYSKYTEDDKVWFAYSDVFEELITHYETQPHINHQFINRLRVLEGRILGDLHLDDEDDQQVQQEVEALATACMEQFLSEMKKLTAFYEDNIDKPYCQNPIDTIKEELIALGMSLAHPNYIY